MATWTNYLKGGSAWAYNQSDIKYNDLIDPNSGEIIFYNSLGTATNWTNQSKS